MGKRKTADTELSTLKNSDEMSVRGGMRRGKEEVKGG